MPNLWGPFQMFGKCRWTRNRCQSPRVGGPAGGLRRTPGPPSLCCNTGGRPLMYLFLLCCNCHCRGLDNKAWGGQTEGRKGSPTHQSSTLLYFSTNIFAIKIAQTVTEVPRKSERTNRISSGPLVQNVQCVFQRFFV